MLHDARIANLLAARKERPDDSSVLLDLARAWNARLMPERARECCRELLEQDRLQPEAWFERVLAAAFDEPEELEDLAEELEELASEHPDRAGLQRDLGLAYYHLERDDEARAACETALSQNPKDSHAREVLAYLHTTVGDLDAAVEEAIQAVEQDPGNFRALHWLGVLYVRLGAPEQAVRYFLRCLRQEECFFLALESLGSLYLSDEETFPMAWQCFARILSVNPRHFPAYFRLADAFIQTERFTEAAAQAEAVLHLEPDATYEADAHQYLGLIRLLQEDYERGQHHFERALSIDPGFAAAHHYLGVCLLRSGEADEAAASFRRAIDADPDYANPRVRLGYICFDRKEYENARRHFEDALDCDPDEWLAHLGLGELARWRKDWKQQLEHCLRASELAPDDSNVQNQLGTAYDALDRNDEALACYERALRLEPLNRQAAANLAHLHEKLLERAGGDDDELRAKAVEAWRRRLLICRDTGASQKAARGHLANLGIGEDQISDWLEHGQLA